MKQVTCCLKLYFGHSESWKGLTYYPICSFYENWTFSSYCDFWIKIKWAFLAILRLNLCSSWTCTKTNLSIRHLSIMVAYETFSYSYFNSKKSSTWCITKLSVIINLPRSTSNLNNLHNIIPYTTQIMITSEVRLFNRLLISDLYDSLKF